MDQFVQEDHYDGETHMEEKDSEKYLGDIISSNAKNVKNIASRKNKSIGICRKIMTSLNDLWLGKFHFEAAILLRNSLLISSLLSNSEAWHNLTEVDLRNLEKADENLLAKILDTPVTTPKEMLYLELGVTPIRFIIKSRRLNFLKYIMEEPKDSLVHQVLDAQFEQPTRNDWGQTILEDLKDVNLDINAVKNMTRKQFKTHI